MAVDSDSRSAQLNEHGTANGHSNGNAHVNGANGVNGHAQTAQTNGHETKPEYEPIAIIGCAMRLPGGVETAESLWDLLDNRREGRCRVPENRYNVDSFYGPGRAGHVHSAHGHFLQHVDLTEVDTSFWSMTRQEIEEMDPQQRLALEVVYECFQSSGTTKWKGKNIGTYMGVFGEDWADMLAKETQQTGVYRLPGTGDFIVANRISYEFGLQGPSTVTRTACSSSLTALHEACIGIQRGECESAIVGGTNLILSPSMTIGMSEQGVISPDGRSKTFDIKANGYARAEGVVAIHVKKLSDAIRDNDPIRGVIRASCLNSDGRTSGMTQPSSSAHHQLITRSHKLAGVDISKTAMVECHGTGTPIGDPLEIAAVARAFGTHGVYIGSLKPNLGHSEGASGVSSTIKAMLALEHRLIPPNINFTEGNPRIPFKEHKLTVPVETSQWPEGKAERIGVNSFGIGGANAHILLESAAENGVARNTEATPITNSHYLLTFSASHPDSLRRTVQRHEAYLREHPERLADLSYTLNLRREPLQQRAYAVVDTSVPGQALQVSAFGRTAGVPSMAFGFTGQGAQWPRMGADLLETNAVFRKSIAAMEKTLKQCPHPPEWTLFEELQKSKDTSRLMTTEWSQPCCTAVQVALVDVLSSWGVTPSAVVGHSSGEIAAAYASGALSKDSAIQIAYYRGMVTKEVNTRGAMAAVGLGRGSVEPLLLPGVVIACENSPSSVTISGDADAVDEVVAATKKGFPDAAVRALRVDCAYHSHHMQAVADKYLSLMPGEFADTPRIPFFSSVMGGRFKGKPDGKYWATNLVQPVLFSPAVSAMLKSLTASTVLLEVGPHSALAGPVRQILQSQGASKAEYASTLARGLPGPQSLLSAAGRLYQLGVEVDMASFVSRGRSLTDLPLYPWRREGPFWSESRMSKFWRNRAFPKHDVLGERVAAASDAGPTWRNLLKVNEVPWLRDHKVSGDIVFPAAGFMAIAGEAIRQLGDVKDSSFSLREVNISTALVLQEGMTSEIITHLRPVKLTNSLESAWHEFDISALHGDRWVRHAAGQVRQGTEVEDAGPAKEIVSRGRNVDPPYWYKVMERFGLEYGPHFQGLRDLTADVLLQEAVATVNGPVPPPHTSSYAMHPTTIDFALQLYSVASSRGQARRFTQLAVPSYIGSAIVRPTAAVESDVRFQVAAHMTARGAIVGDAFGVSGGSTVFELNGLRMSPLADVSDARGEDPHAATEMVWKPDVRLLDLSTLSNLEFYKLASHYKPDLRVLEIGAGNGDTSETILSALSTLPPHRGRHYGSYTFTDISPEKFTQAKERFATFEAVEYRTLDISQDPTEQGFETEAYDLIIISDATATSLSHARKLLAPTGHVLIQNATEPIQRSVLSESRFEPKGQQLGTSLVIRPAAPAIMKKVTLLTLTETSEDIQDITVLLENKGYAVDKLTWGQEPIPGQDILALVDLEGPFLKDMQSERYIQLQSFVRSLQGAGVLWVTGPAQINCTDPSNGLIIGLARTMRTEQSLDFATLELENFNAAGWNAIGSVLSEFQLRLAPDDATNPVMEWAFANDNVQINRFHWVSLNEELSVIEVGAYARKLDVGKRGFLNTLYWKEDTPQKPQGNHLRIKTYTSGLNFKDVLIAMGIVDGIVNEGDGLGLEAAGIVDEIGPDVKSFKVGDRCIAFASGALSSHLTTTEYLCVKIPDELSFPEAATMPTVYCTAIYSLKNKAGVEPGQSVLIHSAAGGVGIAAIQVCRWLEAEIYCTVGSEEKASFLVNTFGIPRNHIFYSRDLTFRRDILAATNGKGVDVVLNSLSGELLHGSWDCVAEYGTMIEIGKRDLIGKGALALHPFEQNRSYIGIDFGRICAHRPQLITRLLQEIVDLYQSGTIKPISPMACFDAVKVEDSMRFMQKGAHMGKVVINLPEDPKDLASKAPRQEPTFTADASYLLAGGLGGLGQAVAVWMAESGATEIVFLSRSADDPDRYATFIRELKSLGCDAVLVPGNVAVLSDVEKAVFSATKPIRGAMQATMLLKDAGFLDMTFDEWQAPLLTKVQGTWNMHNALLKSKLDFFLLFSSWSGIVGYTGQANYAAANAFLDSFVQYRHSQGLTGVVIDLSAVESIGYVSRTAHVMDHFRATSTYASREEDVLDSLHVMVNRSAPSLKQTAPDSTPGKYQYVSKGQISIGLRSTQALSSPNNRVVWKRDPRMSLYKNMDSHDGEVATGGNEALKHFLVECQQDRSRLEGDEAPRLLATEFGIAVFGFLMRDVELLDLEDSLEALGVDSLVSIELRNWFRQRVGLELTTIEILGSSSLFALGQLATNRLKIKYASADDPAGRKTQEDASRYLVAKAP